MSKGAHCLGGDGVASAPRLRRTMLAWYERNRRALPWRASRDPYAIWISEAMLQQTRVEIALERWPRFLARFPDVRALARASGDDVLAAWSGLGYYGRARSLHAAARTIVERHGGEFPRDPAAARELPGVGPYTAGAVLSIAYGAAEALVDGNVARVLARVFAHDAAPAVTLRWAWVVARELVPRDGSAGDWNQALMELGATVCAPRAPRCGECPLRDACAARAAGVEADLPRAKPRREPVDVALAVVIAERGRELLVEQRPARGRMASMWQFPTAEEPNQRGERSGLFPASFAGPSVKALVPEAAPLAEIRHSITHHRIRARVYRGTPRAECRIEPPLAWVASAALDDLALTGMTRKALAAWRAQAAPTPRR